MSEAKIRLTPRLMRAARAMAGWQQAELAESSGVPKPTISAFELKPESGKLATMNHRAIIEAFARAGIEFIPQNGGGAGLRFRDRDGDVKSES